MKVHFFQKLATSSNSYCKVHMSLLFYNFSIYFLVTCSSFEVDTTFTSYLATKMFLNIRTSYGDMQHKYNVLPTISVLCSYLNGKDLICIVPLRALYFRLHSIFTT